MPTVQDEVTRLIDAIDKADDISLEDKTRIFLETGDRFLGVAWVMLQHYDPKNELADPEKFIQRLVDILRPGLLFGLKTAFPKSSSHERQN